MDNGQLILRWCLAILCGKENDMSRLIRGILLAAGVLLAGSVAASDDYIRDYADRVKAADWSAVETLTVALDEHSFEPSELRFKAGKAYKLQLKNVGKKDHYFTAEKFFRSVAWRKVMVDRQGEIKAPYFTAFEPLKNGGQIDLYFVPVTRGSYEVICTIDDHKQQGMTGTLFIE
jgi:uncharacterized cupredoxin-like copper-binding protein